MLSLSVVGPMTHNRKPKRQVWRLAYGHEVALGLERRIVAGKR